MKLGPRSQPSAFNIYEAFLEMNRHLLVFGIRPESECLLNSDDYWAWYSANQALLTPRVLTDTMKRGRRLLLQLHKLRRCLFSSPGAINACNWGRWTSAARL